ncbi:MAG TPA: GNAT family N-acetyltransferase [Candidatus Limnocylindrales bacterium]
MSVEIRIVPADGLYGWARSVGYANSEEIDEPDFRDIEPTIEPDRTFGAYDGDQVVGGGSVFTFDVTVPGGSAVPSAGVTWVGIMPTHRRQGALRQMMLAMLEQARDRHEPLAVLWASEGSIYQRFGYGLATLASSIEMERDRAILVPPEPPFGRVRLVDVAEAKRLFAPIFEHNRALIPGFYSRSDTWWDVEVLADFKWARRGFDRKFYAVHEADAGQPDAYAIYRVKQEWANAVPGSELFVQEIMAIDGDALREMWRFLLGVDLIKRITSRSGSRNQPLLLMTAEPRRVNVQIRDGMWLRIVDVADALQRRGYSADGTVVLEVRDEFLPAAGGRFRLTTRAGTGTVERTADAADIALDASDLGALYLGGFSFLDLARAGRARELTPGARARADAMMHSAAEAWCPQTF